MSHSTTTSRRWQILLGVALTAVLALGAAFLASGASQAVTPDASRPRQARRALPPTARPSACSSPPPSPPPRPAPRPTVVTSALGRAANAARATASDDVRELAQNLADDLAAYRTTLTTPSDTSAQRHTDIGAALRSDLTALRHYCGL